MTRTVRTTMRPDQPIEVGEAEYLDLKRQKLLLADDEPSGILADAGPPPATKKPAAVSGTARSKEN
ncbi:hypothetical protein [Streptomyces chartreusis]|uniref:hypothetical protein n=1 Tax=Streptomyces chartreusis TaxID=1969 RepID=UPI00123D1B94|nr:hypothetical protein [Streptomyces chartreusis]QEV66213.1 hypothetical protein CP983_05745 [Streptomyces chartreusis]GGW98695.1 hypothetical protein GCM10010321_11370 [Streptomyces chartreusis]